MSIGETFAFSCALLLMVITPGPGVLACVSRALTSGFKMSVFVILGIQWFSIGLLSELLNNYFEKKVDIES